MIVEQPTQGSAPQARPRLSNASRIRHLSVWPVGLQRRSWECWVMGSDLEPLRFGEQIPNPQAEPHRSGDTIIDPQAGPHRSDDNIIDSRTGVDNSTENIIDSRTGVDNQL